MGIEGAGSVVASTDATAVHSLWTATDIDAPNILAGLSCPSTSFCVATDSAGNVITSADPTGGASTWRVTHVIDSGLGQISCASASLCVALVPSGSVSSIQQESATGNVIVSTNPSGGSSAWSQVQIDSRLGDECGKYGPWDGCGNSLTGVACPSAKLCVVTDELGEVLSSRDPGNPSPDAWSQNEGLSAGPVANEWDALACPSDRLCVAICPIGFGGPGDGDCPGNNYSAGDAVAWNPSTFSSGNQNETSTTASPDQLHNVWCPSESACFAADDAHLYASPNPDGSKPAWSLVDSDSHGISTVACPTASRCIAFDGAGDLLVGSPPATVAQIKMLMRSMLLPRSNPRISSIVMTGSYVTRFTAPRAGRLTEVWYQLQAKRKLMIAFGTQRFSRAMTKRFNVKLTASGLTLLRTATAPVSLSAAISFAPTGEPSVTVRGQVTLRM